MNIRKLECWKKNSLRICKFILHIKKRFKENMNKIDWNSYESNYFLFIVNISYTKTC